MKSFFEKSPIFCLSHYFVTVIFSLYFTFFTTLPAIGADDFEEAFVTHPLHASALETDRFDTVKDLSSLEIAPINKIFITEDDPLISAHSYGKNALSDFVKNYVIGDKQIEESLWTYRMRLGIKALVVLYASTGGVPYIDASCQAGQGNMFLCVSFAGANVICSGALTVWAALRILKYFDPISTEEKELLDSKTSCNIFKHIACNVLGVLASIPGAYSVFKYNSGNLKLLAIQAFLNNYILSTVGYYEITNPSSIVQQLLSRCHKKDEVVKTTDRIKEKLSFHLKDHVIPLLLTDPGATDSLFSENDEKDFLKKLLLLKSTQNEIEGPEQWRGGYPRNTTQIIVAIAFPCGNAVFNFLMTYEVSMKLTQSATLSTSSAIIAVIAGAMIDLLSTTTTSKASFDFVYNKIRMRNAPNFTSSFYPILNIIIPFSSAIFSGLSVAGGFYMAQDAVQTSFLHVLGYTIPIMVFASSAITQSFAVRDLLHNSVNYFSTYRQGDVGEIVRKINRLEKFTTIISNCVPSILYDYWDNVKGYLDDRINEYFSDYKWE